MKTNNSVYELPTCQEISQRVKLATQHQQNWYRDELIHPAGKQGIWVKARSYVMALGALFSKTISPRRPARTQSPDLKPPTVLRSRRT